MPGEGLQQSFAAPEDALRYEESCLYEEKIRRLEDNISALRLSRRILMSLLEQVNSAQRAERESLLAENRRLRQRVNVYARRLWKAQGQNSCAKDDHEGDG